MIDFHTHLLPGIDDGSPNIQMTEKMLREEKQQGVETVVATPHFYANRSSINGFLDRRAMAIEQAEQMRREAEEPLPAILAGAEVYYFPGMGEAEGIDRLCIGETRTILVEMPFTQWGEDMLKDLEELIFRQKLKLALAHIERYITFQREWQIWNRVMSLPIIPQINAESLIKSRPLIHTNKKRKFCFRLLSTHPDTVLGSDCHDAKRRPPNIQSAEAEIIKEMGTETILNLGKTAKLLLTI